MFIGGFVVWFAIGFPNIDLASGASLAIAYGFNVVLKIASFPLAAWPLLERLGLVDRFSCGRRGTPVIPATV